MKHQRPWTRLPEQFDPRDPSASMSEVFGTGPHILVVAPCQIGSKTRELNPPEDSSIRKPNNKTPPCLL